MTGPGGVGLSMEEARDRVYAAMTASIAGDASTPTPMLLAEEGPMTDGEKVAVLLDLVGTLVGLFTSFVQSVSKGADADPSDVWRRFVELHRAGWPYG